MISYQFDTRKQAIRFIRALAGFGVRGLLTRCVHVAVPASQVELADNLYVGGVWQ